MNYDKTHIKFTRQLTEDFIHAAMLNDEEAYIMRSRVKGTSVTAQALYLHCSEAKVHKIIKNIKKLYDLVQKEQPNKFPPRRTSKTEKWLDTH